MWYAQHRRICIVHDVVRAIMGSVVRLSSHDLSKTCSPLTLVGESRSCPNSYRWSQHILQTGLLAASNASWSRHGRMSFCQCVYASAPYNYCTLAATSQAFCFFLKKRRQRLSCC